MALLNRAKMTVSGAPGTGAITLSAAVSGFASFAEAGAEDATVYTYVAEDGNDFEIGHGTYTESGATFSRDTVLLSKISGTAGTTKLTLTSAATVAITIAAEDFNFATAAQGAKADSAYNRIVSVKDFDAVGDGEVDDLAAFNAAIAAAPGGRVFVPYSAAGYLLSGNLEFAGSGKAKWLEGEAYVKLIFDSLSTSVDAVTMNKDTGAGFVGFTIDVGNTDASDATYTKGRDGIRIKGGEWPTIDAFVNNCGRDGVHYEGTATGEWLENLSANLRVFNCGRDAIHLNCANFNTIFANELDFKIVEARRWKRHAVHCVVNTLSATYASAKISNVLFPKMNLDAQRNAEDMDATDLIYFETVAGAPGGGLFDAFTFGNGGWENVTETMSGYCINCDSGATVTRLKVEGPIIIANISAPSNDPSHRIANFANLTAPYWIFDTVTGQTRFTGTETNDDALAGHVGEVKTASKAFGSPQSLVNGTATNITSLELPPGDWDVYGFAGSVPAGTTTQSFYVSSLSTTSATMDATQNKFAVTQPAGQSINFATPFKRVKVATGTTQLVYLVLQINFAVSTCGGYGNIVARRAR